MALLLGYSQIYARHGAGFYRPTRRWIFSVLLGVLLAGLVLTGSRAGLLAGLMMILIAGLSRLASRSILGWGFGFAVLLWSGIWLWTPDAPIQSAFSGDYSDKDHWATLTDALELWRQSPVFGAGLGVFIAKSSAWSGHPLVIHNTPLWILAEFGLVGAAIMGWALFLLARHAIRFDTFQPARSVLLLLILAFALFGLAHEIFYQRIFWLVLGAVLARPGVPRGRA